VTRELRSFTLHVELDVDGVLAVVGPSGAGKSTLLRLIAGLDAPSRGRIECDGDLWFGDGRDLPPERRRCGFVFQDYALFPHMTVRQNVAYGADGTDIDPLLDRVGIRHLAAARPPRLSGGERQRVALARAVATRPRLLLLDEPLAAVDVELKERIVPYLLRVRDEKRIPFVYVTHNAGEAAVLAKEVMLLRAGRVESIGRSEEVLKAGAVSEVDPQATFENVFDGVVEERAASAATLRLAGGVVITVPADSAPPPGERAVFGVLPEDVLVSSEALDRATISARNVLSGEVQALEPLGGETLVRIGVDGSEWRAKLTAAAVSDLGLRAGKRVWIAVKTHAFRRLR